MLFVHGGLWPGGVGRWAVVVVGVVLVVEVVGPLVVVVWVVVGLVLRVWPMDPLWVFRSPLWGLGVGHRWQSPGLHYVVGRGGGSGAGLDGDGGRGVPSPWVGLAGGGGGLWGMDDGALGDGDADEGLDGVVLGGRLCGGGGCRWEGGAGCGGLGVLAWVRVRAGVVSDGFVSLRLWCCVCSRGRRLGFGVGLGVGVRFQVEEYLCPEVWGRRCRVGGLPGALPGCPSRLVGVGGSVCAAPALAFAVALKMRAAGRGGSEDEVEELDEAEDEEEVVDAGWAVMRAGLWAAASAAATAGRMEGMSSGCRLGAGGWGGPVVTWRPGGPIWSAARGRESRGCRLLLLGLAGPGSCNVRGRVGWRRRGGTVRVGCIQGPAGMGLGPPGCVRRAWAGHWVGWACRGARGSFWRMCVGCRVWGAVKGVRRVGVWRACAGVRAGGGGLCRWARGCPRWWACVGLRLSSERGGAWAGIVRWGVLCRCMCPLAAARLRGQL